MWKLCVFAVSLLLVPSCVLAGDEDCAPLKSNERHWSCCKPVNLTIKELSNNSRKCLEKVPPVPTIQPGDSLKLDTAVKNRVSCLVECVFLHNGLLTEDKTLDKDAIMELYSTNDKELAAVVDDAVTDCLDSHKEDVEVSMECKSGGLQFTNCVERTIFTNCPTSYWNASKECTDFKAKLVKCPKLI